MTTLSFADVPQGIDATGISRGLLEDLALKVLYLGGELSLIDLGNRLRVGLGVTEEIFQFLRREQLCEVKGMDSSHRIVASSQGKHRAMDLLAFDQYAGPAPVSLADYTERIRAQSVQHATIGHADLTRAFSALVLDEALLTRLGTAMVSGTSAFLYGPPGTGKTTIAAAMPAIYDDRVWIPYSVEVDGQIITVHDPGVHERSGAAEEQEHDRRWILCRRPCVFAGGELTAEMLDLPRLSAGRNYAAPLQMKANNGILIIDDFGRQRMRSEELLNRWMTPLDRRIDFLTLPSGRKFEIPFDPFVVFSTNFDVRDIADEAFMRRVPNKIKIDSATPWQFAEIFRRECKARSLDYDAQLPEFLIRYIREELKMPLCQCDPRNLINQICWEAEYRGTVPSLTADSLTRACASYFAAAKVS